MDRFRGLLARLRALVQPSRVNREIDEELHDHLEREAARNLERGMAPAEARDAARRSVGNIGVHRESARDAYGGRWLESILRDAFYGARALRKSPGFTAAAVLSLALGIGANTAIFSAIDALLLRSLPVANPEELVTLEQDEGDAPRFQNLSFADYERFRTIPVFAGMFATTWADGFNVRLSGPEAGLDDGQSRVSVVTGNFFTVMGVGARVGRTFTDDDDRVNGAHPVVVISDRYWSRRFGRSPDAIGRELTLQATTYTIIGVTPRGFEGDWVGWPTDMWIPVAMVYQVFPSSRNPAGPRGSRFQYKIVGRLAKGVTLEQAQAAAVITHARIAEEAPPGSGVSKTARLVLVSAAKGYSTQRDAFRQPLVILMFTVGAVLLIACANVANLLLARAAAREREFAVRLAIGAGRGRIIAQLLTESALLALLGGGLGLLIAQLGTHALESFGRAGPASVVAFGATSVDLDLRPNGRIIAFTVSVCALTAMLFGLAPAFRASGVSLLGALTGRGADARRSHGRLGINSVLVVLQIALSIVLMTTAGLFLRSLSNLRSTDLGLKRDRLLLVWTYPGYTGRERGDLATLFRIARDRIASIPGVVSASQSVTGLFGGGVSGTTPAMRIDGASPDPVRDVHPAATLNVGPDFFRTVGQQLVAGRDFNHFDNDSAPGVMIVDAAFAQRLFGAAAPIGRRVSIGGGANPRAFEIVGVVTNARVASPRDGIGQTVYFPYTQSRSLSRLCLVIRLSGDPASIVPAIREELRAVDPSLPILRIDTVDEQLDDALFRDRLVTRLSLFFAVLAVLLACLGLYGVLSYLTARRTSEIGIRMALGATRGSVLRGVLGRSMVLAVTGTVIGILATLAPTRFIGSRLYGIGATDPATIVSVAVVMLMVAGIASYVPAWRAASVPPVTALRQE